MIYSILDGFSAIFTRQKDDNNITTVDLMLMKVNSSLIFSGVIKLQFTDLTLTKCPFFEASCCGMNSFMRLLYQIWHNLLHAGIKPN